MYLSFSQVALFHWISVSQHFSCLLVTGEILRRKPQFSMHGVFPSEAHIPGLMHEFPVVSSYRWTMCNSFILNLTSTFSGIFKPDIEQNYLHFKWQSFFCGNYSFQFFNYYLIVFKLFQNSVLVIKMISHCDAKNVLRQRDEVF